jgi:hypothetical protein
MDWKQLWEILSAADNVPIVAMIPLLAFYMYLAWKQAHANDVLIEQLAGDAALAKTHHRKAWPFQPGWAKEVHVWPFLLRIEFLAAIIVTIILMDEISGKKMRVSRRDTDVRSRLPGRAQD